MSLLRHAPKNNPKAPYHCLYFFILNILLNFKWQLIVFALQLVDEFGYLETK